VIIAAKIGTVRPYPKRVLKQPYQTKLVQYEVSYHPPKKQNEKLIIHFISTRIDDHFLFTQNNFPTHETKRFADQYKMENG
jgi:hypothetical protein